MGKVDATTLACTISHSGGLLLAQRDGMGWKALSLTRFQINITGALNSTFGTALPTEVRLGTADVLARAAH